MPNVAVLGERRMLQISEEKCGGHRPPLFIGQPELAIAL
jgi:hypothetical protein